VNRTRANLRRSPHACPRASGQAGDTLVELLIALTIIAIAASALMGMLTEALAASGEHRTLAVLDTILRSYAESAKSEIEAQSSHLYTQCANGSQYNASAINFDMAPYSGYTASVTNVEYLDNGSFQPTCSGVEPAPGVQLLTITATAPNQVSDSLQIVVRNPNYVPSYAGS